MFTGIVEERKSPLYTAGLGESGILAVESPENPGRTRISEQ